MLALIQPQAVLPQNSLSALEVTSKVLEKQVQARRAGVAARGSVGGDVSLESLVESALAASGVYGIDSSMVGHEAQAAYGAALRLLELLDEDIRENTSLQIA